jgi:hypothetical protein
MMGEGVQTGNGSVLSRRRDEGPKKFRGNLQDREIEMTN